MGSYCSCSKRIIYDDLTYDLKDVQNHDFKDERVTSQEDLSTISPCVNLIYAPRKGWRSNEVYDVSLSHVACINGIVCNGEFTADKILPPIRSVTRLALQLKSMYLEHDSHQGGPVEIYKGFPNLTTISFRRCHGINDEYIHYIANNYPELTCFIYQEGWYGVTSLIKLAESCTKIEVLVLSKTHDVDGNVLNAFTKNCKNLIHVDVISTDVDHHSVIELVNSCKLLRAIHVSGCRNIPDGSLDCLAIGHSNSLIEIGVNLRMFTQKGIDALISRGFTMHTTNQIHPPVSACIFKLEHYKD